MKSGDSADILTDLGQFQEDGYFYHIMAFCWLMLVKNVHCLALAKGCFRIETHPKVQVMKEGEGGFQPQGKARGAFSFFQKRAQQSGP